MISQILRNKAMKPNIVRLARFFSALYPEVPFSPELRYYRWLLRHYPRPSTLKKMTKRSKTFAHRPLISVLMPVFRPPIDFLEQAIASVKSQSYENWELCIVDDGSQSPEIETLIRKFAERDNRVRIHISSENRGIVAASNLALSFAQGEFVALLDHDDLLTPHALFRVVENLQKHPHADVFYSDEDKMNERGQLQGVYFKPDWCPDSFLSRMYLCHLTVLRKSLARDLGGFREEFEGGHLYDLLLRLTEVSNKIFHIPDVLYHWRMHPGSTAKSAEVKPYVYEADKRALEEALVRRGEEGDVVPVGPVPGFYNIRYRIRKSGMISIIIPSKDHAALLGRCLESIFSKSTYRHFEIILVDNGSTQNEALSLLDEWSRKEPQRFKTLRLDVPFNFSYLCNQGVALASGEYLLFLNNDTEVISEDWLEAMLEQAQRPSIGAVGALLFYENGCIQHAGAILGLGGVAAHSHRGLPGDSLGYAGQVITTNNYLSVAATCLMCRREVFEEVGPFDEELPGDYEDVDLCLKMHERGYRNVSLPHVKLYHYESFTRGKDYAKKDPIQQKRSVEIIRSRWRKYIEHDPCYSPHLTRAAEDYRVR